MNERWAGLLMSRIRYLFEQGSAVEIEVKPVDQAYLEGKPNLEHMLGRTILRLDPKDNSGQMEGLIKLLKKGK